MKINKSRYDGYIWYSDKAEPKVLCNEEFELEIDERENPFIIEGQLYDRENNSSVSLRYVDGRYIFVPYNLNAIEGEQTIEVLFPRSKKFDGKKLKFVQYWRPEADPLCEAMMVLQPKEYVFVGFEE